MRFVIAIFELVTSLSAQIVCKPVDSASFDSAMIFKIEYPSFPANVDKYLVTDYPTRPVRCYERIQGTFSVPNGKFVQRMWGESKTLERWMSDSSWCSASRSKEPLYRFMSGIRARQPQEAEKEHIAVPPEFCGATDR